MPSTTQNPTQAVTSSGLSVIAGSAPSLRDILPPDEIAEAAEKVRVWMETNGYRSQWILGGVCSRDHAKALTQARCGLADANLTIEWQERILADFRRVIALVAKHADFSQCPPQVEEEVDRLNRGEGGPAS